VTAAKYVGIETARKTLGPLVTRVQEHGAEIVLTRNGKPAARIVQIPQETPITITLVSANPGDVIDGVEISDPACPFEWTDLPKAAKDWATGQGYGPDAEDELIYVVTEGAEVPTGFPVFLIERDSVRTSEIYDDFSGRSFGSYDLLDEMRAKYGLDRRAAHESIHAFLAQCVEIDGDAVIVSTRPVHPHLLDANPTDLDVRYWLTIGEGTADTIRESFAAVYGDDKD
jgi:prevent-host-death family protein